MEVVTETYAGQLRATSRSRASSLRRGLARSSATIAMTVGCCTFAAAAAAQDAAPVVPQSSGPSSEVQEIIVTAQKRAENLQDVPLTVLAITGADALRRGLTGTDSLTAAIPGLVITNPANVGNPYLRGVGSALFDPSSEQSVALYIDGVYISAPESNLFSFNNIKQVEVLKGPQGTLFGRNATGGVIQITTKDPSDTPHADISAGYGNYGDFVGSAYVTGGVTNGISADLAARYENQSDGFGRNLTTGAKTFRQAIGNYDLRGKVLLKPTDTTRVVLSADYSHSVSTNAYQKPKGTPSPIDGSTNPGRYNSNDDFDNRNTVNTGGASIKIDQDVGTLHLMDILAYRKTGIHYDLDDDVTAFPAANITLEPRVHNWSEEFQVSGPSHSWLRWIVGFYYFDSYGGYNPVIIDGAKQVVDSQKAVSYAGFGQATATVLPGLDATVGIRYTTEKQKFDLSFPVNLADHQSFNRTTYRAALDYHLSKAISAYASFNTGFKSGGYNLLLPGNSFRPESLKAYEVGLKTELFDRRLRLNVDGFYYDDTNVQVLNAFLGGTITSNAAAARIKGIEADFEAVPANNWRLSGGISVQTGKYTSYPGAVAVDPQGVPQTPADARGNKTLITPPVTGNISLTYKLDTTRGSIEPSVTLVYNDGFFWQADNRLRQPAYALLNASVLLTSLDGKYELRLWGKNLTNSVYYIARLAAAGIGDVQEQAPPRTYGFSIAAHF